MKFNEDTFNKALDYCKIIKWEKLFKQVVKTYLKLESKDKKTIIKTLLDQKAEENNTIDLNVYAIGLESMYDALHDEK